MMPIVRSMFGAVLVVALAWAPPVQARVVKIEMSAPLSDRSDRAVDQALKSAVDRCVQGANAMGLSWIWLHDAAVHTDSVVVQMIATDEDAEGEDQVQVQDLKTALDRPL